MRLHWISSFNIPYLENMFQHNYYMPAASFDIISNRLI
eukprot:UN22545